MKYLVDCFWHSFYLSCQDLRILHIFSICNHCLLGKRREKIAPNNVGEAEDWVEAGLQKLLRHWVSRVTFGKYLVSPKPSQQIRNYKLFKNGKTKIKIPGCILFHQP